MLSIRNVQKVYGSGKKSFEAVHDVSFEIEPGEFVCIVGPSGAGKTTLLKCISGLLDVTAGEVELDGRAVVDPPREMAFVFQDYSRSLLPWFTVERNVGLPLQSTIDDRSERRRRVTTALSEVSLDGSEKSYPWQLSGGMQQRVAIARALAYQPEILLMDEPFASVDAQTRADLEDLILKVRADIGVTILLVTHDIDEAVYLADKVIVVSKAPTVVVEEIPIFLPRPRDQLTTKGLPEFVDRRAQILRLIRNTTGDRALQPQGAH